ncbi:MAG: hypothetical protein U9N51_06295, partial [Bacteroidota bacterium]|nr:hypothetical protein [Bacteroidota bacterium]
MKKIIICFCLLIISFNLSAQNKNSNNSANKLLSGIEISGGKLYSPYRYFLFYNGYENINISIYHTFSNNLGLSFSQSYGRMFDDPKYNRGIVFTSTFNFSADILKINEYHITLYAGTGLEQIHLKDYIYDCIYPLQKDIYGIPIRLKIAFAYNVNNKFSILVNAISRYSFMYNDKP